MDTVRLARDLGTVSGLLPKGIDTLRDIPYQLMEAIKAALMFLDFEELARDDVPPRSIWTDAERLREHFDRVRRREPGAERGEEQHNSALDMLVVS